MKDMTDKARKQHMRYRAYLVLELTKGICGTRDNALKSLEEMAGYVMELTNDVELTGSAGQNNEV